MQQGWRDDREDAEVESFFMQWCDMVMNTFQLPRSFMTQMFVFIPHDRVENNILEASKQLDIGRLAYKLHVAS